MYHSAGLDELALTHASPITVFKAVNKLTRHTTYIGLTTVYFLQIQINYVKLRVRALDRVQTHAGHSIAFN